MTDDHGNPAESVHMTRNTAGIITTVDAAIVELLGWQPHEWVGSPSTRFIHPDDQASAVAAWMEMITTPGVTRIWRGRYQTVHGGWQWLESTNRLEDTDNPRVITSMRRVDEQGVSVEEQLRAREQLLGRLSEALPVGVFQVDLEGRITFTNDRLHSIVGVDPRPTVDDQLSALVVDDRPLLESALAAVLGGQPVDDIEIRLAAPGADPLVDGVRTCLLSLRTLTDAVGVVSGAVGCLSDVTDRTRLRRELEIKAAVDELTSCLNRAATLDLLGRTIAHSELGGPGYAVLFIDLDRFKEVNDRYGHAAGDRLLVATAVRLRGAVRDCDDIGRFGGDEFLVICPRVGSTAEALGIAKRIAGALTCTVDVGPSTVELRASIGVAWTGERLDPDTLIAQADLAMYESKRTQPKVITLFTAALADNHESNGVTTRA